MRRPATRPCSSGRAKSATLLAVVLVVVALLVVTRFVPGSTNAPVTPATERAAGATGGSDTALTGLVTSVADGDTLTIQVDGSKTRVRLLGIDAPEVAHDPTPAQCGADEARSALVTLAPPGTRVTVTTDPESAATDEYGRVLGYVATADVPDVALHLIEAGLAEAWVPSGEPKPTRWATYTSAQKTAQRDRTGSWATCARVGR